MQSPVRFSSFTDTTRAGRCPACSCPCTGSKLVNQISPCSGASLLILEAVHQRPVELPPLPLQLGPTLGVAFAQFRVERLVLAQEQAALRILQQLGRRGGLTRVTQAREQAAQDGAAGLTL